MFSQCCAYYISDNISKLKWNVHRCAQVLREKRRKFSTCGRKSDGKEESRVIHFASKWEFLLGNNYLRITPKIGKVKTSQENKCSILLCPIHRGTSFLCADKSYCYSIRTRNNSHPISSLHFTWFRSMGSCMYLSILLSIISVSFVQRGKIFYPEKIGNFSQFRLFKTNKDLSDLSYCIDSLLEYKAKKIYYIWIHKSQ